MTDARARPEQAGVKGWAARTEDTQSPVMVPRIGGSTRGDLTGRIQS